MPPRPKPHVLLPAPQLGAKRLRRPKIVKSYLETRAGFRWNDVERWVAYIHRDDFEIRGIETRRAFVERRGSQGVEQPEEFWNGVIRPFGIGGMALAPRDNERAVERAAPADLLIVSPSSSKLVGSPSMQ
jgi:hypothetical protein